MHFFFVFFDVVFVSDVRVNMDDSPAFCMVGCIQKCKQRWLSVVYSVLYVPIIVPIRYIICHLFVTSLCIQKYIKFYIFCLSLNQFLLLLPYQINMAELFWYLVKSNLSIIRCCTSVLRTRHFLQVPE